MTLGCILPTTTNLFLCAHTHTVKLSLGTNTWFGIEVLDSRFKSENKENHKLFLFINLFFFLLMDLFVKKIPVHNCI